MPIDGGLVVGYLTAALVRAGRRLADRTIDALLDQLTSLVRRRLGQDSLERLAADPRDEQAQRDVGLTIDGAARVDAGFGRELAALVERLDRRGGRQVLNQVYADMNVQAFDHGVAVGRDFNYFHAPDPADYSDAAAWVKGLIVVGSLLAVAGMGLFGYTLFTGIPEPGDPDFGQTPAGFGIAAAVFFAGFVMLGIAALGRGLSRRR
jgi:hypothetical protein